MPPKSGSFISGRGALMMDNHDITANIHERNVPYCQNARTKRNAASYQFANNTQGEIRGFPRVGLVWRRAGSSLKLHRKRIVVYRLVGAWWSQLVTKPAFSDISADSLSDRLSLY